MASLPRIGETISGFTVTELGTIHMLGARTVLFNHESSGAQLLYIQNDDRELGFNLIYRTPQLDERGIIPFIQLRRPVNQVKTQFPVIVLDI